MKTKNYDYSTKKYRMSIIASMDTKYMEKFGFERSYIVFERSVNRMVKQGDLAEKMAYEFLNEKGELSENISFNRVIALNTIKIEADFIDYDNKNIYEVKSRKKYENSKQAIKEKWAIFEYDKKGSNYEEFTFKGVIVVNEDIGPVVKKVIDFNKSKLNVESVKRKFDNHYELVSKYKKIKKVRHYEK